MAAGGIRLNKGEIAVINMSMGGIRLNKGIRLNEGEYG